MRIPAQIRSIERSAPPRRVALPPSRRDLAGDLLAVVSSSASLLRAASGAVRSGVTTITGETRSPRSEPQRDAAPCPAHTTALIYELLDAHYDTALLADELDDHPDWQAHLDYLRALQRKGRELLARMPAGDGDTTPRTTRAKDRR